MSPQRYRPVSNDADEDIDDEAPITTSLEHRQSQSTPSSPPPSFRSHASSPRRRAMSGVHDPLISEADRNLADTFDAPSDSDDDEVDNNAARRLDARQRVLSGRPIAEGEGDNGDHSGGSLPAVERRVTRLPFFSSTRRMSTNGVVNDGVFANLSAKPDRNAEDAEEKPPTYEQAAADATPPYWENTIFAPSGGGPDDVYVDGLPVGSFFSFVWNGMISMSFQLVGFLLTYLLHSTHAAKNGSKAGLGITLIQYGFSLKTASSGRSGDGGDGPDDDGLDDGAAIGGPSDPNNHDFDPDKVIDAASDSMYIPSSTSSDPALTGLAAMGAGDWFAYALMIVGWFILIRAISEYLKARRHEALVLQSPSRGLNVAVVAEGETPARSV